MSFSSFRRDAHRLIIRRCLGISAIVLWPAFPSSANDGPRSSGLEALARLLRYPPKELRAHFHPVEMQPGFDSVSLEKRLEFSQVVGKVAAKYQKILPYEPRLGRVPLYHSHYDAVFDVKDSSASLVSNGGLIVCFRCNGAAASTYYTPDHPLALEGRHTLALHLPALDRAVRLFAGPVHPRLPADFRGIYVASVWGHQNRHRRLLEQGKARYGFYPRLSHAEKVEAEIAGLLFTGVDYARALEGAYSLVNDARAYRWLVKSRGMTLEQAWEYLARYSAPIRISSGFSNNGMHGTFREQVIGPFATRLPPPTQW